MEIIADILMVSGALGAGIYCFVLSARLRRFNDLEKGVGGAVAVLSAQVDDLTRTLATARSTANESAKTLEDLTHKAEDAAKRLELMVASMHDLPPVTPRAPEPQHAPEPMFVRHARPQDGSRQ